MSMMLYCVNGRWGRHRRNFSLAADSMDEAVDKALLLAKLYATGTRNYTTETWKYGSIEVISEVCERRLVRGERANLYVFGEEKPWDPWAPRPTNNRVPTEKE